MAWICRLLCVLMCVSTFAVSAADDKSVLRGEVKYDGNFYFYPSTPNTLYLVGDIGDFDTFEQYSRASVEFRRAIRNHRVKRLVLASGGGAVDIGLNYASIIKDKGFAVYVPESVGCFSACSFMFFGGEQKTASGPVGVHQFYTSSDRMEKTQVAQQSTQYGVADIIAILNSFQVPPRIYEHMFSRVGNDFYNLTELDLEELGASQVEEWHKDADEVIASLIDVNAEVRSLVAFVKGEETQSSVAQQEAVAAQPAQPAQPIQPQQPSREEIIRLAFMEVQKLLNEHNCGAGIPDGIVGPRTEAAFQKFVNATGVTIDFDANDAFEQLINTLSQTKRPACKAVAVTAKPAVRSPNQPSRKKLAVLGDWATVLNCTENGRATKYAGRIKFYNERIQGALLLHDVVYELDKFNILDGTMRHFPASDRIEFSLSLKGRNSNSLFKRWFDVSNIAGPTLTDDSFTVQPRQFDNEFRRNDCSLSGFRIKKTSASKSHDNKETKSIKVEVSGPAWVKIVDANNYVLFKRFAYKYSPVEVTGKPPLTINIDRADRVTAIKVNGREFGNVHVRNNSLNATVR